jgi:hypothetical protein
VSLVELERMERLATRPCLGARPAKLEPTEQQVLVQQVQTERLANLPWLAAKLAQRVQAQLARPG